MNIKKNWRKAIIFVLLHSLSNKIPRYLKEIEQVDKLFVNEQKVYQQKKLENLLLFAWKNVSYYHEILQNAGVVVNKKVYLENFKKVPILTKDIIRHERKNLYSWDHKKHGSYKNTSGGSTGEPVEFLQDKRYNDWNIANKIHIKRLGGQDIGERELRLWGSERDILEGKEKLSIRVRNWLYNRRELNAFRMSELDMERFVKTWNDFKPTWVETYVQSIYELTRFIQQKKLSIHSPHGIVTSAGVLYPEVEKLLRKVFACPVYNRYGSREAGDIACSDQSGQGLRLSIWNQYIEVVDGKIYVTTLNNLSMPLVRYEIGDMAIQGKHWGYIQNVKGRTINFFKNKKGELIDGEYFTHLFYLKDWINNFQVIQKELDIIEINIVLNKNKNKEDIKKIDRKIKIVMGDNCRIRWNFIDKIYPTKSGKYLYTISEIT